MPHRELRYPRQIQDWLAEWGSLLTVPGEMILIGSGALLACLATRTRLASARKQHGC